jgi:SAM-dependent methyltransferase
MPDSLPNYKDLDLSGEALQAATRMEARAREPASAQMFEQLVAPLLSAQVKTVLEFGCGTASLSRRVAQALPQATVYASDKSQGMLKAARSLVDAAGLENIRLEAWDALDDASFPFGGQSFDLILSSVVIPYFDDTQTEGLIRRLVARLTPGGVLAFIEQDLGTDTVNFPKFDIYRGVLTKDLRNLKSSLGLGLRPLLRAAGLQPLSRRSFLWTDDAYGDYTRDLLERLADASCEKGHITPDERDEWKTILNNLAASGDFYYGIVYHLIAGQHIPS